MPRVHSALRDNDQMAQREDYSGLPSQYRTDNFMMYGFKVAMCSRQGRHPWGECPFAHPTENARRRDPRLYSYSCMECPAYRHQGFCPKGDQCEYSHGIFEARLHPDSYRTVRCQDGGCCRRKICFFYHDESERRDPTGLTDARAQLAAELGESVFDLSPDTLKAVTNNILTSQQSLSGTLQSLSTTLTAQPPCISQTLRSAVSNATAQHAPAIGGTASLSAAFSVNSAGSMFQTRSCLPVMATDTVAPCMKGANRNKVLVKELAAEVELPGETLLNALRIAALQGELSPHSSAPSAPPSTFPPAIEALLDKISEREDCPIGKLRGWLLRALATLSPSASPRSSPRAGSSPRTGSSTPRNWAPPPAAIGALRLPQTLPGLALAGIPRGGQRGEEDDSARLMQTFSSLHLKEARTGSTTATGTTHLRKEGSLSYKGVTWGEAHAQGAPSTRSGGGPFCAWRPDASTLGHPPAANEAMWR